MKEHDMTAWWVVLYACALSLTGSLQEQPRLRLRIPDRQAKKSRPQKSRAQILANPASRVADKSRIPSRYFASPNPGSREYPSRPCCRWSMSNWWLGHKMSSISHRLHWLLILVRPKLLIPIFVIYCWTKPRLVWCQRGGVLKILLVPRLRGTWVL